MKTQLLAAMATLSASTAWANVIIDFEGPLPDGITLEGGTRRQFASGEHYMSGAFTLTFAPRADLTHVAYQAAKFGDWGSNVAARSGNEILAMQWVQGNANPFCQSAAECLDNNFDYIPPDKLFDGHLGDTSRPWLAAATSISFATDLADNITFFSPTWNPASPAEVPEPSPLWLLILGTFALFASRSRHARQA